TRIPPVRKMHVIARETLDGRVVAIFTSWLLPVTEQFGSTPSTTTGYSPGGIPVNTTDALFATCLTVPATVTIYPSVSTSTPVVDTVTSRAPTLGPKVSLQPKLRMAARAKRGVTRPVNGARMLSPLRTASIAASEKSRKRVERGC